MKTEAENKRLFKEARELRVSIKTRLHNSAKNKNVDCRSKNVFPISSASKNISLK